MRQAKVYFKDTFAGDNEHLQAWFTCIDNSFLSEDLKEAYKHLVLARFAALGIEI